MANHSWSHFDAHDIGTHSLLTVFVFVLDNKFIFFSLWLFALIFSANHGTLIMIQCQLCWCAIHLHVHWGSSIQQKIFQRHDLLDSLWYVHAKRWSSFNLFRNPSAIIFEPISTGSCSWIIMFNVFQQIVLKWFCPIFNNIHKSLQQLMLRFWAKSSPISRDCVRTKRMYGWFDVDRQRIRAELNISRTRLLIAKESEQILFFCSACTNKLQNYSVCIQDVKCIAISISFLFNSLNQFFGFYFIYSWFKNF